MNKQTKFHDLTYFKVGDSICGNDFEAPIRTVKINLAMIVAIHEPEMFYMPLSGKPVKLFSTVKMVQGTTYVIGPLSHKDLIKAIES